VQDLPAVPPAPVSDLPVVILCGGDGTRLREETEFIPKPMVTVGGKPILWHLMQYFSSYGFLRFVLCLGYKAEVIKNYFLNYHYEANSFSIHLGEGRLVELDGEQRTPPWTIACVDTGERAMTGARVKRIQRYVGDSAFLLTYGDGLADVDLPALLEFHRSHGKLVTVTGVHPPARFGLLVLDGTDVTSFSEKAHGIRDYINGGFMVCEPGLFDYLDDDDACTLEHLPLERVAADGQMEAFLHESYWQCMDTKRDRELLEEAWSHGAPWRRW
jgi:glucose-1-phosphate cytidylyltransferase